MVGKLCKIHIPGKAPNMRRVWLYDDNGMCCASLFEGDIVLPIARDGDSFCYYIVTQHGVGRLEDEFIQET